MDFLTKIWVSFGWGRFFKIIPISIKLYPYIFLTLTWSKLDFDFMILSSSWCYLNKYTWTNTMDERHEWFERRVYCYENFGYIQKPVNSHFKLKWPCTEVWRGFRNYPYLGAGQEFYHISQMSSHEARTQTAFFHKVDKKFLKFQSRVENICARCRLDVG